MSVTIPSNGFDPGDGGTSGDGPLTYEVNFPFASLYGGVAGARFNFQFEMLETEYGIDADAFRVAFETALGSFKTDVEAIDPAISVEIKRRWVGNKTDTL